MCSIDWSSNKSEMVTWLMREITSIKQAYDLLYA